MTGMMIEICQMEAHNILCKWKFLDLRVSGFFYLNISLSYHLPIFQVFCFSWVLRHTNTVKIIWRLSSFVDGGNQQVTLRALFQTQAGS